MDNRTINKKQNTLRFHVDNIISSHVNPKVNDKFGEYSNEKYGKLKSVEVHQGKVHKFLGMNFDFSTKRGAMSCRVCTLTIPLVFFEKYFTMQK